MEYKGVNYGDPDRVSDRRFVQRVEPRKTHTISKIWEIHDEITRRLVLGEKNVNIAKALNCSEQTVSNVRNSPIIQDKMSVMKGARDAATVDIARDIQEFAPVALDLLKNIVMGKGVGTNASPALRAKEANGFLDRAGFAPIRREQHMHAHLTPDDIEEIKLRAFGGHSPVVEAEYEENQPSEERA